jgi:hypothetical protein
MLFQVSPQTSGIACIEKMDGPAKQGVLNSLMVRQLRLIGWCWFLNTGFQARPTWKSILTGNCELCICEAESSGKDFSIAGANERWMKLSDPLSHLKVAGSMAFQQVFCLILEMVKTGIRREVSHWHDELPFLCPGPHIEGRKSVREIGFFQVDFCPFRGPDAPSCATSMISWSSDVNKSGLRFIPAASSPSAFAWLPSRSQFEQRTGRGCCNRYAVAHLPPRLVVFDRLWPKWQTTF